jgi:hypothetical protein
LLEENEIPQYRIVSKSMGNMPIGMILSMPINMGKASNKLGNSELTERREELHSSSEVKVVLFNKFQEDEVKKAMQIIKPYFPVKPIFAVVTPTSIKWKFKDLLEHLLEEKKFYESK